MKYLLIIEVLTCYAVKVPYGSPYTSPNNTQQVVEDAGTSNDKDTSFIVDLTGFIGILYMY